MKIINNSLIIAILLTLASCNQNNMLTKINADGSCTRSFTQPVDSSFLLGDVVDSPQSRGQNFSTQSGQVFENTLGTILPVNPGNGWEISWQYGDSVIHKDWPVKHFSFHNGDSIRKITATLSKHYPSVNDMTADFQFSENYKWHKLKPEARLEKKFRWFYTLYRYQETFPKLPVHITVPIEKFFTKDEASFWFTGTPDLVKGKNGIETNDMTSELEKKSQNWFLSNVWDMQYNVLIDSLSRFPNHPSKEQILSAKDSLFNIAQTKMLGNISEYNLGSILNTYFKTKSFNSLLNTNNTITKAIMEPIELQNATDLLEPIINYHLLMPGNLIETNGELKGDTVYWKLDGYRMLTDQYIITASSKKFNVWVTLFTFLLLAGFLFYAFRRKKTSLIN